MEQTRIWNYFQNDPESKGNFFIAYARYNAIAKHLKYGQKVLNIGVGHGGLEIILQKKGVDVYSLDPDETSIQSIRDILFIGDKAMVGISENIPVKEKYFDAVIMSEVLEHLTHESMIKTLQEVYRVLKTGGKFISTVPAEENLYTSKTVCPDCGKQFHRWGHIQNFSQSSILTVFNQYFDRVKVSREYYGNFKQNNLKGKIFHLIKKTAILLGAKGNNENFFICASKN